MRDIFSHANPEQLLFRHITLDDLLGEDAERPVLRTDYSDPREFLQVAAIRIGDELREFMPHAHVQNERTVERTQELWHIVTGSADVELYDINLKPLGESVHLNAGDTLITFGGGHEYSADPRSIVLEVKNGPWLGRSVDKVEIDHV